MVGAGDDSRALLALRSEAAVGRWRKQQWEVEFARYFTAPPRVPSTLPPPGVRYAFHAKRRHPGAWLPATAPATLCVSRPIHASTLPVLTVSFGDVVFEEHFLSILNFSWPQITCMTECPVRGSRVVFVSFCDKSKQIQKFALRFPLFSDAESFLNCVKECLGDTRDIIPSGSDYACEDSSVSEYIASNELQDSFEEPASDHRTEAPALCYHEEPDQPAFESNIDNINSGFPPSFTEMLTNLSTENEKDTEDPYHGGADQPVFQPLLATNIDNINSGFPPSFTEMLTNLSTENEKDTEDPYHGADQPVFQPLLATNIDNINSGFPPRFTEMLTNLSTENETDTEDPRPLTGIDHTQEVYTQDTCHDVASDENTAGKEMDTNKSTNDIMARIKVFSSSTIFLWVH
uniref:Uncharacterized protein n=1 Tax=Avena sativa TaxID=4498 RepID=A0ACD5VC02_AVESA